MAELRQAKYQKILDDNDLITLMRGKARFEDARTLLVSRAGGGTQRLGFDHALVATGASPTVPPIPGLAATPWWNSTDALFSEQAPESLAVIGSSFVALEITQAYQRLGSQVTVLARNTLLSHREPEIGAALQAAFEADGIRVRNHTRVVRVDYADGRFTLTTSDAGITASRLLVATGRTPNTGDLNLDRVDVETHEHRLGFVMRGRALGFAMADLKSLLDLVDLRAVSCADVEKLARTHLQSVREKINDLTRMECVLTTTVRACSGQHAPECPLIDTLFGVRAPRQRPFESGRH